MRRIRTALVLTGALILPALVPSARAETVSASMEMRVTVVGRTLVEQSGIQTITVRPSDVARGYIELPAALQLKVRSNARDGYLLRFPAMSGAFAGALVTWSGNQVEATAHEETWIQQPPLKGERTEVMSVRLLLAAGALPGEYPMPVRPTASIP